MEQVSPILTKRCSRCNLTKPLEEWYKNRSRADGVGTYCKLCEKAVSEPYRRSPEGLRKAAKRARKRREKLLRDLGGVCACCGETTYEFLQFDHIKGDGSTHRRELKRNPNPTDIRKRLEDFRVLCCNCNFAVGAYGYCPHVTWQKLAQF